MVSHLGMLHLLCFLICSLEFARSYHLSSSTVLLPYDYGIPSNITLRVFGGGDSECFEWISLNQDVVIVDPICEVPNCCREARVSAASSKSERVVTLVKVIAKGTELKCHVITDNPSVIELSSLTEKIFLNGPPVMVSVTAKDNFGHSFSSINGLIFDWKASKIDDAVDVKLQPVPVLNDHSFDLEKRGILGHKIILGPGENYGLFKLSASLKRRDLLDLKTSELTFEVSPNIGIYPSNSITLIKGGSVKIYLEDLDTNLKLEDSNIVLEEADQNSEIVYVDKDSQSITALKSGETKAVLKHSNTNLVPTSYHVDIKVVKPTHLRFRISGGEFSSLEERKIYTVTVEICDSNGISIFPSDNIRIATYFPSSLFYVFHSSSNGTYHVVQALVPGKGTLKAEFKGILNEEGTLVKDGDGPLHASLPLHVYQSLSTSPSYLLLPSDSDTTPLHEIRLMASGGSGRYLWNVDDKTAATIRDDEDNSHVGHLQIFKKSDKIIVTASDPNNPNFISTSLISIQNVVDIEVYPTIVEAVTGNTIVLPVSLLGYEDKDKKILRKFDECSKIRPKLEIIDKNVIVIDDSEHVPAFGKGCLSMQFKCKNSGYSRINIFYEDKKRTASEDEITLKTTTVLACYKPLKPVHPVRIAVLPLGASKEIAFEGGPRKWILKKTAHYEELDVTNPESIAFEIIRDPIRYNRDLTVFQVTCLKLGENTLTFRIGNKPSATNPYPAKEETSIKLICSEPHSVHLKLSKKAKNLENNIVKVPFYGDKKFEVDVWIKDETGRKLSNISTLAVDFEVSDDSLAEADTELTTYANAIAGYRKITRDFKTIKMTGETGALKVTAKVKSYKKEVLEKMGIKYNELKEISESLDLKLVSLRDINAGLYAAEDGSMQDEEGTCDGDSCKS